jgi:hypothetical protein
MDSKLKGRIIFSDNYRSTIESIKSITGNQAAKANVSKALTESTILSNKGEIGLIEGYESKRTLDPSKNENFLTTQGLLSSYDESILELNSLEGKVRCISHCCTVQNDQEYVPAGYVTLKFFTRSDIISGHSNSFSDIIRTDDPAKDINDHYIQERKFFLEQAAAKNSVMFIDGSLFSGAATSGNFLLINDLLKIGCKPIFFVKNSESTIITEKMERAKGYNSDLHWAHMTLKGGEMSEVFYYSSPDGRAKAMCFMKIYNNRSPIRIELPLKPFKEGIYDDSIFDLIYYQFLANGNLSNVQPRIIQVAEMYAREILKSTNIYKEIERLGLTKSMNEERF